MNQTHFIADLHLCEDTPKLNMLFLKYLADWVGRLDALYILGDLFDAWVGDDDHHHATEEIIAALRAFAQQTPVFVQHGNRDFLLGAEFARRAGVTLLDEVHSLHVYDRSFVLVHGDSLCTDDTVYQQFRSQSRHPAWQAAILAKPLAERRLLAAQIRQVSEQGKAEYGQADILRLGALGRLDPRRQDPDGAALARAQRLHPPLAEPGASGGRRAAHPRGGQPV